MPPSAGSLRDDARGELANIGYTIATGRFSLGASSQRRFGDYYDLADTTLRDDNDSLLDAPISQDRLFASISTPTRGINLGAGYIHIENASGVHRHNGVLSLRYPINSRMQFQARSQTNLNEFNDASVFAGLSVQLDSRYSLNTGVTWSADTVLGSVFISRNRSSDASDYSYALGVQSDGEDHQTSARAHRQFEKLDVDGSLIVREDSANLTGQMRGSLAFIDKTMHISRYINNAFVVADAGYEGVLIKHENRGVGTTDANGLLLIPDILPYEGNKISIDPDTLPIAAIISETDTYVRVQERAGALVRFAGAEDTRIRINAYIRRGDGGELPPGTPARVLNTGDAVIIGHDGQLFFSTLDEQNQVEVITADGLCLVDIALPEGASGYVDVGERTCQPTSP